MESRLLNFLRKFESNTHYMNRYIKIIDNLSHRIGQPKPDDNNYYENHHIVPRSYCETKELVKDLNNQIYLTYREHVLVHWIFYKATQDESMLRALKLMISVTDKFEGKVHIYHTRHLDSIKYKKQSTKKQWYYNPKTDSEYLVKCTETPPIGSVRGRKPSSTSNLLSGSPINHNSDKKWYYHPRTGKTIRSKIKPEGFLPGRSPQKKK